ncbi:hypothetical protein OROGR_009534 [Orobanche gracilis]
MAGHNGSSLPSMSRSHENELAFLEICYEHIKSGRLQTSKFKGEVLGKINEQIKQRTNNAHDAYQSSQD